jgi:hypothetical protein
MILLTGAAGFIGSAFAAYLNEQGLTDLVLVDDFSAPAKRPNWLHKRYRYLVERDPSSGTGSERLCPGPLRLSSILVRAHRHVPPG